MVIRLWLISQLPIVLWHCQTSRLCPAQAVRWESRCVSLLCTKVQSRALIVRACTASFSVAHRWNRFSTECCWKYYATNIFRTKLHFEWTTIPRPVNLKSFKWNIEAMKIKRWKFLNRLRIEYPVTRLWYLSAILFHAHEVVPEIGILLEACRSTPRWN